MPRFLVLLLVSTVELAAQSLPGGHWKTDLSKRSIELSELRSGGPPKDGIPAIDQPKFETSQQAAGWLHPKEPVLVVEHAGEARAYPLQILIFHELVNDQIGDLPILASYCPLCNSAITFDRRIGGQVHDFGVSGMLRMSDMVMYDRQTDSLWQQLTGEGIVGEHTGKRLEIVSSQILPFDAFADNYPEGKVLSRDTGHRRAYGSTPYAGYEFSSQTLFPVPLKRPITVPPMDRLVTFTIDGKTKAYRLVSLRKKLVEEGRIKKTRYVILAEPTALTAMDARRIADSRSVGTVGVFSSELEGQRLKFKRKDDKIVDKQTGSTWNVTGKAVDGPLKGKRLEPIEHGVFYAFAWMAFHPDTEIVGAPPSTQGISGLPRDAGTGFPTGGGPAGSGPAGGRPAGGGFPQP